MKKNVENVNITTGNPVGTIINFYGKTAPEGYLICDGETYNRADYPELAEHLTTNFEDLVGDGETTFKVPDLRGEFLRGTGINSHTNQGSGGSVGDHQDGTLISTVNTDGRRVYSSMPGTAADTNNADSLIGDGAWGCSPGGGTSGTGSAYNLFTSRPTNTSVLYCIKF